MAIQIPRGTQDILPGESEKWQYIERVAKDLCDLYQYQEIRTPIFESTELFEKGVGDTTDIVQKEMYTFHKGNRSLRFDLRVRQQLFVPLSAIKCMGIGSAGEALLQWTDVPLRTPASRPFPPICSVWRRGTWKLRSGNCAEVISLAMNIYKKVGLKKPKLSLTALVIKKAAQSIEKH